MEYPNPIFAPSFDFCINNFFPEREHEVLGEVMCLLKKPSSLPKPKECGKHRSRIKQLLLATNTVVYYWDYGRVWQFVGVIENGNGRQLAELDKILNSGEFDNDT